VILLFFTLVQQPTVLSYLVLEVSRSHTHTHKHARTHTVEQFWTTRCHLHNKKIKKKETNSHDLSRTRTGDPRSRASADVGRTATGIGYIFECLLKFCRLPLRIRPLAHSSLYSFGGRKSVGIVRESNEQKIWRCDGECNTYF